MNLNNIHYIVHIPRTGGSSVANWLQRRIGRDFRRLDKRFYDKSGAVASFAYDINKRRSPCATEPLILMSHVGIQNWTPLQQQYTILRDPIDRIISYFYATQDATQVSLDDWIDIPNYSIRNAMTWMLAGSSQFKPEQAVTTQSTFEKAMSNLRHMDIVGTTENLNLFMFMLSNRLNIRFDEVPHTNQSERPLLDRVPQRIRNKIADLNKFDLKLWKEAKEWL